MSDEQVIPIPPTRSVPVVCITQAAYDALRAENEQLRAQVAAHEGWEDVPNGTYRNKGSMICVGNLPNQISVSQIKPRMNIWVGELPSTWRLQRRRTQPGGDNSDE